MKFKAERDENFLIIVDEMAEFFKGLTAKYNLCYKDILLICFAVTSHYALEMVRTAIPQQRSHVITFLKRCFDDMVKRVQREI